MGGGRITSEHQPHEPVRIVPHVRTLRKAREQVKHMVITGTSSRRIRNYLHRWVVWWANASEAWQYDELLRWFLDYCWDVNTAAYAEGLLLRHIRKVYAGAERLTLSQSCSARVRAA